MTTHTTMTVTANEMYDNWLQGPDDVVMTTLPPTQCRHIHLNYPSKTIVAQVYHY